MFYWPFRWHSSSKISVTSLAHRGHCDLIKVSSRPRASTAVNVTSFLPWIWCNKSYCHMSLIFRNGFLCDAWRRKHWVIVFFVCLCVCLCFCLTFMVSSSPKRFKGCSNEAPSCYSMKACESFSVLPWEVQGRGGVKNCEQLKSCVWRRFVTTFHI